LPRPVKGRVGASDGRKDAAAAIPFVRLQKAAG
jgi:hypothetical protein